MLLRIEFEVGEGRTRPVQLALVPMLLVLPPAIVPALIAVANVLVRLPEAVAARRGLGHTFAPSPVSDAWFAVGPALVLCVTGVPSGIGGKAVVLAVAVAAQIGFDWAAAAVRLKVGLGLAMREQLSAFAWVYLVDLLLTPVALLAAIVAAETPVGRRGGASAGGTARRLRAGAPRADRERPRTASNGRAERGTTGVDRPELG